MKRKQTLFNKKHGLITDLKIPDLDLDASVDSDDNRELRMLQIEQYYKTLVGNLIDSGMRPNVPVNIKSNPVPSLTYIINYEPKHREE